MSRSSSHQSIERRRKLSNAAVACDVDALEEALVIVLAAAKPKLRRRRDPRDDAAEPLELGPGEALAEDPPEPELEAERESANGPLDDETLDR